MRALSLGPAYPRPVEILGPSKNCIGAQYQHSPRQKLVAAPFACWPDSLHSHEGFPTSSELLSL